MLMSVIGFPNIIGNQILKGAKTAHLKQVTELVLGDRSRAKRLEVLLKGLAP